VLQASWVHVYWSIPFILSWSLMESLSTGCCVVASDTPPVREMIRSGDNGILVDFHSPEQLAQQVDRLLRDRGAADDLGQRARQLIREQGYGLEQCLPRQLALINRLAQPD